MKNLPIIALRNAVLFPNTLLSFDIGRTKSIKLLESLNQPIVDQEIAILTQVDQSVEDPGFDDLYTVGTLAKIAKVYKNQDGNYSLIVQGVSRIKLENLETSGEFLVGSFSTIVESIPDTETSALYTELKNIVADVVSEYPDVAKLINSTSKSYSPSVFGDIVSFGLEGNADEKCAILSESNINVRLTKIIELATRQREVQKLRKRIGQTVKEDMTKAQREYVLRQELKAIRDELGEGEDEESDVDDLMEKLSQKKLPQEAATAVKKQIKRLKAMQPATSEYTVARTYVDWMLDIPWTETTSDNLDIENAKKVFEDDHYGLEKVKKRLIEFLAVRKLNSGKKSPIVCLVGPPGVGKTSIASSVAKALGRKFHRISLGGVHDESSIRGHRRTYVGSMPGKIMSGMKKVGVTNPMFLLDEIDKMGKSMQGDPAAAMLEVLDPEQNRNFVDHYIDVPYDLSNVLFFCTANNLGDIPGPLRDRMEIIDLTGYTRSEKLEIAKRHLIPKQVKEHGLMSEQFSISDEAVYDVIDNYTREAGVRKLEQKVASVIRHAAVKFVEGREVDQQMQYNNHDDIAEALGKKTITFAKAEPFKHTGITTGLAWTAVGGDVLFVEMVKTPGSEKLKLTGQLGDVMKESAQIAYTYVKSNYQKFGLDPETFKNTDIHIHFPAGAIPKDGPSAGVTMVTSLVSLLTNVKVNHLVAMTGEVSLVGEVMPIGGVKEKVTAAYRAGIKKVILPKKNEPDLDDVPKDVRDNMEFFLAEDVSQVLENALLKE